MTQIDRYDVFRALRAHLGHALFAERYPTVAAELDAAQRQAIATRPKRADVKAKQPKDSGR